MRVVINGKHGRATCSNVSFALAGYTIMNPDGTIEEEDAITKDTEVCDDSGEGGESIKLLGSTRSSNSSRG